MNKVEGTEQLHVTMAIQRLQGDLQHISQRLELLEIHRKESQLLASAAENVQGGKTTKMSNGRAKHSTVEQVGSFATTYSSLPQVVPLTIPKWFPFQNVNWATVAVVLSWPFVAQYIVARLRQRRPPL